VNWIKSRFVAKKTVLSSLAVVTALVCGHSSRLIAQPPREGPAAHQAAAPFTKPSATLDSKEGRFRVRLDDGTVIELVGVGEHPSAGCHWWRGDGSALAQAPIENGKYARLNRPRGDELSRDEPQDYLREFIVRATTPDKTSTLRARCLEGYAQGPGPGEDIIEGNLQINHHFAAAIAAMPKEGIRHFERADGSHSTRTADSQAVDIDVEFSSGPWDTVATCGKNASCSGVFDRAEFEFGLAGESDGEAGISVAHTYSKNDLEMRLVAGDQEGTERTMKMKAGSESRPNLHTHLHMLKAGFSLSLAKVKEFRFQTRRLHRIEFRNVAIAPRPEPRPDNEAKTPLSERFHIIVDGRPSDAH